ncbi:MAG TPA: hypothetical protein VF541_23395 [Longimicrobium sp.]
MKVKLDDIRVDSFATTAETAREQGTVRAFEATPRFSCQPQYTCPECASPVMPQREQED